MCFDCLAARRAPFDPKLRELGGHVEAVRRWRDLAVDIEDPTISANVERPADGRRFRVPCDAERLRRTPPRITEEGIIKPELPRELPILL